MKPLALFFVLSLFVPAAALGQSAVTTMAEIDRMREAGRYREALVLLEGRHGHNPSDAEVLWRLSRTRVDLGEQAPASEQKQFYHAAMTDAEAAVAADPQNAEAHLALAIAAGRAGLIAGTREKVELSRVVKESADRAIALDPQSDAALHVRGRWHYEVASLGFFARTAVKVVYGGLPDASYEQAAQDFERALGVREEIRHYVELGKTYVKLGDEAKARAALERALALPAGDPDDPGYQREARTLLDELG